MEEQVVLVNEQDVVQGLLGKTEAHEKGLLHRAISIIIFNKKGEMLIQQRADAKYHWAGIWSNTVCTHPRDGETYKEAAQRRLKEEDMDINETYERIMANVKAILVDEEADIVELAECMEALDNALVSGMFFPGAWMINR